MNVVSAHFPLFLSAIAEGYGFRKSLQAGKERGRKGVSLERLKLSPALATSSPVKTI